MSTTEPDYRGCVDKAWARPWITPGLHSSYKIKSARDEVRAEFDRLEAKKARQGGEYTEDDTQALMQAIGKAQLLDDAEHGGSSGPPGGFPTRGRNSAGSGSSRVDTAGARYGRVEGLGHAWLQNLGEGNPVKLRAALDSTSGGTMTPAFFDPNIRALPQRALFVRSLLRTVQIDTDKFDYMRATAFTNNATAVAPHATKPTSPMSVERIEDTVRTIATVSEAQDRMLLADVAQLTDFIDNSLRLMVLLAEENQLINGDGTGVNIKGILNVSGIQTQARASDPAPDAVKKAIVKVQAQFFQPDGVILNPTDWLNIRLLRTTQGASTSSAIPARRTMSGSGDSK